MRERAAFLYRCVLVRYVGGTGLVAIWICVNNVVLLQLFSCFYIRAKIPDCSSTGGHSEFFCLQEMYFA